MRIAIPEHPALCNRRDCRSMSGRDRYWGVSSAPPSALRLSRVHRQGRNFFSLRPPAPFDMSHASRPTRATGNYRRDRLPQVSPGESEPRARLVLPASKDQEALPASLAVPAEPQAPPGPRARPVLKDCRASRAKSVPLDRLGLMARPARRRRSGRRGEATGPQGEIGATGSEGSQGCRESKAKSAPRGKREPPGPRRGWRRGAGDRCSRC